ncbi:hypothetical protein EG68_06490 [Paragonimus skrjabini miyazakii]|uniref:Protein kintoun n=1 Tax=Paragonimus skrjabini miyazakii TaxID=59628 RepID=A0A8S9YZR5_9TREM|nr:hypothetical protein EG68_06490 [Paragonimus skrjabini miyazakii]
MARDGLDVFGEMNLTNDEVLRLKKAFGDPEFRKLFKEYADEISDPQNRKRYEEEICLMERERGMDVEFINPMPGHCLKTRHWPKLDSHPEESCVTGTATTADSVKVFINICKSEKVGQPVMKAARNSVGKQVPNGCYWSLPHCFTPPREDFDKNRNRAIVYDVAFHSKAFELAMTSPAMRRLLDITAIEGVQRQFDLRLGKTAQQARYLSQLLKAAKVNSTAPNQELLSDSNSSRSESVAREEALLRSVRLLKGIAYKGVARPTVIRRRRPDYDQCHSEVKRRTAEDIENCQDPSQREALRKLASFPCSFPSAGQREKDSFDCNLPVEPTHSITYSSDYDMINCRDAPDVCPLRPPDRLRIAVNLPGLQSSSCLDLEVTSTHLHLHSEKPVAYKLELALPYEVDDSQGVAKFDKSTSVLTVTVPLAKTGLNADGNLTICSPNATTSVDPTPPAPMVEITSIANEPPNVCSTSAGPGNPLTHLKRKRRKRNRRRSSTSDTGSESDTLASNRPSSPELPDSNVETPPILTTCSEENISAPTHLDNAAQPNSPQSSGLIVPVTQIGVQQLFVSKDRRLAPVRFRQDPLCFSILLPVRGILPDTVRINWAIEPIVAGDSDGESANAAYHVDSSVTTTPPLLLLLTFSSRGAGGCTMDWGLVLRCPSCSSKLKVTCREQFSPTKLNTTTAVEEEIIDTASIEPISKCYHQDPPRIVSSAFSTANAVLVLTKPLGTKSANEPAVPYSTEMRRFLNSPSVWWNSVAIGRTLSAGMQECPFVGVETCLLTHPAKLQAESGATAVRSDLVKIHSMSATGCEITWRRSDEISLTEPPIDSSCSSAIVTDLAVDALLGPTSPSSSSCQPSVQKGRTRKEFICAPLVLKSILKQRSYSESSGDEPVASSCALRDAGLADTRTDHLLSSDEFPTASSDEDDEQSDLVYRSHALVKLSASDWHIRRCVSNEKLHSASENEHTYPGHSAGKGGRQRRRSVNFSSHDQQLAYSPRDTVEALHHALVNRRKKARRRETRRRNVSGSNEISSSELSHQKSSKQSGRKSSRFFSGNNSVPETSGLKSCANLPIDLPFNIADSGDLPCGTVEPKIAEETSVSATDYSHIVPDVILDTTCAPPLIKEEITPDKAMQQLVLFNRVTEPERSEVQSVEHFSQCAVHLSAATILELDEE